MDVVTGNSPELVNAVKALGVPIENLYAIDVRIRPHEIVEVELTYKVPVTIDVAMQLVDVCRRYILVRRSI